MFVRLWLPATAWRPPCVDMTPLTVTVLAVLVTITDLDFVGPQAVGVGRCIFNTPGMLTSALIWLPAFMLPSLPYTPATITSPNNPLVLWQHCP
jgi:hypothetical protein